MELSSEEENVLFDADYLKTKRVVGKKIEAELSSFERALKSHIATLDSSHPIRNYTDPYAKISRGENYGGLPYFMLDYPRIFSKESTFAFRTMVYWATFFSFTVHLSGEALDIYRPCLAKKIDLLSDSFLCVNNTPWEYHYQPDNYLPVRDFDPEVLKDMIAKRSFIKISRHLPMSRYKNFQAYGLLFYQNIISILK